MNLERLQIFLRLVETGSQAAAAELVHLTQPAVSRNVKLLEEDIGASLFERKGRSMVLTPAGRALIPWARDLLERAHRIQRAVAEAAERTSYDARIGAVESIATQLFGQAREQLVEQFPELAIKLRTGRTSSLLRQVAADALDLAIVVWPGPPPAARSTTVGPYDIHYVGRADRFAALARTSSINDLRQFPLVEIHASPGQRSLIQEHMASYAVTESLSAVKALVLDGFGIGALPDLMLGPEDRPYLVQAPVLHEPPYEVHVVGAPSRTDELALRLEAALAAALRGGLVRSESTPAPHVAAVIGP
jgi:DNA-binding transcriptional LysR family regulator